MTVNSPGKRKTEKEHHSKQETCRAAAVAKPAWRLYATAPNRGSVGGRGARSYGVLGGPKDYRTPAGHIPPRVPKLAARQFYPFFFLLYTHRLLDAHVYNCADPFTLLLQLTGRLCGLGCLPAVCRVDRLRPSPGWQVLALGEGCCTGCVTSVSAGV